MWKMWGIILNDWLIFHDIQSLYPVITDILSDIKPISIQQQRSKQTTHSFLYFRRNIIAKLWFFVRDKAEDW